MKKMLVNLNKLFVAGGFTFLFVLFSCERANVNPHHEEDPNKFLIEAKSYFEKEVITKNPNVSTENSSLTSSKIPLWDQARSEILGIRNVVTVPVKFTSDLYVKFNKGRNSLSTSDMTKLLFYRDSIGKMHAEVIVTIPDDYYLSHPPTDDFFYGRILVEDWYGRQLRNFNYHFDGTYEPFRITGQTNKVSTELMGKCYIDYYYCVSSGGYSQCSYSYSKTFDCSGGGGGDIGSGTPSYFGPGEYPSVGGAGSGGIRPDPNRPKVGLDVQFRKIKVDPGTNPCLVAINNDVNVKANLAQMMINIFYGGKTGQYNQVADMISKLATDDTWNVIIKNQSIPDIEDPNTGQISTENANTKGVMGNAVITFNTKYLSSATDLAVARTLIHEMVHAYFLHALAKPLDPSYQQFVELNSMLFLTEGTKIDPGIPQHELMAYNYVNGISSVLYQYALVAGIDSPDPNLTIKEYCQDLAWGGLMGTSAYQLYGKNKDRVEREVINEQTNTSSATKKKSCK